ncbi:MAG: phosphoglucosamine mutase [Bacteroidetes bacterium]|nr:phosphoglucosamine mutase [Bacteroidota bacterium]
MSKIIFSVSGVRGIYGDTLTLPVTVHYTLAYARFCRENSKSRKIIVGLDGRMKGDEIHAVVVYTLALSGFEVIDIGVAPTPTVQLAVEKTKAAGGIAVTASHNPQQWNGLKFLDKDGTFLKAPQIDKIKRYIKEKYFNFVRPDNEINITRDDKWLSRHIDLVLKSGFVNISKVRRRKFKVVVDAVNSSGSVIIPALLKKLGCEVIELYCDGSGKFPHTPEPLPQNLKLLSKAVVKNKADMGFAIDPDGDRLVLICEDGKPYIEENTIVTAIRGVLRNTKTKSKNVVVNMSTTRAADDVTKEFSGKITRSAVGEINVVNQMRKTKAIVGGEGSGGVIVPKIHYGRDAMVGTAVILGELANFKGSISEYRKTIPSYHIVKTKLETKGDPGKLLTKIEKEYSKKKCRISTIDGVKIDFPDYWIHLRKSNTEPIIRIITEAKSQKEAEKIQSEFLSDIKL